VTQIRGYNPAMKRQLSITAAVLFGLAAGPVSKDTVYKGKSLPVSITAPDGWHADGAEHTTSTQIAIQNDDLDAHAYVYCEPTAALDISLDGYCKISVDGLKKALTDPVVTPWVPVKVDGHDAMRCEVSGTDDHKATVRIVTLMRVDQQFVSIETVIGKSKFDAERKKLAAMSDSVKWTPADVTTKPVAERKTIKARDGSCTLTLPGEFVESKELKGAVQLRATNYENGVSAQVIAESRADLDYTLPAYFDASVKQMMDRGKDGTNGEIESIKVAGFDARRTDIHLTYSGIKLVFVQTVIMTPTHFYQVEAYVGESAFEKNKQAMDKIADGFAEKGAAK
jgi:hypothetical protein